jgi:hypothetical protein
MFFTCVKIVMKMRCVLLVNAILISALICCSVTAIYGTTMAHDLTVEYVRDSAGVYQAHLHNARNSAVTAYLVQASMHLGGRERHTAFGGDTLGFANGSSAELPPHSDSTPGHTLPHGAEPAALYVAAVIYADGSTEGDEEIVAMLISGRHRAWADLKESIPALEKSAAGQLPVDQLVVMFEKMQARDQSEGSELDQMLEISNLKYSYFISAVPTMAIGMLQGGDASGTLARFRDWQRRLSASKPDIK